MNVMEESLQKHREWKGKIEVCSRAKVNNAKDLTLAYTPGIAISLSKSAGGTRKPSSPLPGCSLQLSTICSKRTNRTTLNSTARATGHLHTGKFPWKKPSSFYNGKVI